MVYELPGQTKKMLGIDLHDDLNDPTALVPRVHLVLALACLELFGGDKAVAHFCDHMMRLEAQS